MAIQADISNRAKRTWVYMQRPAEYEIALCGCGHIDPDWSEFDGCLWCPQCQIDFVPEHSGIFDGPIGIETSRILGICFDRFNLETKTVEPLEYPGDEKDPDE